MIKTTVGHIQYNVRAENMPFYKELFTFIGFAAIVDEEGVMGLGDSQGVSLWFTPAPNQQRNDYDSPGHNHIGLKAASVEDVDKAVDYLAGKGIPALFDTPRHRPDFSSKGNTYYQVMFETPDCILIEIVYSGPYSG